MKIIADTNVLVRAVVRDDPVQAEIADRALKCADLIVDTLPSLCEFVWVLLRVYGYQKSDIANAIRLLVSVRNLEVDRMAVEAGLRMFEAGGDFADGVIAHEGAWLGGETFVSFDRKAVALLKAQGISAHLLG